MNANEPAYPLDYQERDDLPKHQYLGLTKREAAAIAAMQGLLAGDINDGWTVAGVTFKAVEIADALLAELETR